MLASFKAPADDLEVPADDELRAMQARGELPSDEELEWEENSRYLAAAERAIVDAAKKWRATLGVSIEENLAATARLLTTLELLDALRATQETPPPALPQP